MNRRALLRGGLLATLGLLPGCTGGGPSSNSPTDSPSTSSTDTATPTDSPTPDAPELIDSSFRVESNECGNPTNSATAGIDGDTITVTGTIDGSDTCHTARLAGAAVSDDGKTLAIEVEAYVPESTATQACGQCIVEIEYRSTFTFDLARPDRVVVNHDEKQIAEIPLPE